MNMSIPISDDIQVTISSPAHWAVASELADNSKASKQGWGQTKIGQVLQAKVRCMQALALGACVPVDQLKVSLSPLSQLA